MSLFEYHTMHFSYHMIASFWFGQYCKRLLLDALTQMRHSSGKMSPLQKGNHVYFVRVFSGREIVKPVIDFCVGRHGGQEAVEVCPCKGLAGQM
jgi:hypothetical protein